MSGCAEFRERLAAALAGRPGPERPGVADLQWHAHLHGCARCRALLDAEKALELVLAGLPEPVLPGELAERVLARLRPVAPLVRQRSVTLEDLLELDAAAERPGLSERVLAGLSAERERAALERRLDALLARVPAPAAPAGLAERTLAGLAAERAPRSRFALARGSWFARGSRRVRALPWIAAAAAAGLFALIAWRFAQTAPQSPADARGGPLDVAGGPPVQEHRAQRSGAPAAAGARPGDLRDNARGDVRDDARGDLRDDVPDEELLAALDVLERWDLLVDEDVAVLLASIDPAAEEILDLATDAAGEDEG